MGGVITPWINCSRENKVCGLSTHTYFVIYVGIEEFFCFFTGFSLAGSDYGSGVDGFKCYEPMPFVIVAESSS